ncbi:ribonuclease III [Demequina globuliformis]|uniref:ribonuclease III n=1 Tax=Demequina globuliformis TaxID=676202 RepID=UPI000A7DB66F|nr:ribonuclease III [Demequina globuliformis]
MTIPGQAAADALVARLGVFIDPELLVLALTHRSFAYEAGGLPTNERLEFLGDSVLGVIVTDRLYRDHPDLPEGELAKMRAATVSQKALSEVGRAIEIGPCILLGKGERSTGGSDKDSILCDAVEAIIGAVYLTHGIDTTRDVVLNLVGGHLAAAATSGVALDWKTSLQEAAAERGKSAPVYTCEGEGPDHARTFTATVRIDGEAFGTGVGTAKKHAEQAAAAQAYEALTGSNGSTSVPDEAPAHQA